MLEDILDDKNAAGNHQVSNCGDDFINSVTEFSKSASGLNREHTLKLETCAIPAVLHKQLGFKSLPCGSLEIPYLTPEGLKEQTHSGKAFTRLRLSEQEARRRYKDKLEKNPDFKLPKYVSLGGEGCRIFHSPLCVAKDDYQDRLNDVSRPLRITEGEFKTIAANIYDKDVTTIGIGGVHSWRDRYDGQSKDEDSKPLIDWDEIPLTGRTVRLCFDSDLHKPQVRNALRQFSEFLSTEKGANVYIEVLPSMPVKDDSGKWIRLGIDDLIYHYGKESFLAVKDIAQPAFKTRKDTVEYAPELEPSNTYRRNVYLKAILGKHWKADDTKTTTWSCWTGTHWQQVHSNDSVLRTIETFMEANNWQDREQRTVNSLVAAFRRSVGLTTPKAVDGLVPCLNGCLRLSDKKLIEHNPNHGNTYCLPFEYQPTATYAPVVDVLKSMITPTELNIYRAGLHSVVTGVRQKAFIEITGPGNSGKSVFSRLATAMAGVDNTAASDLEKMEDRSGRFETYKLRGKRLAVFNECDRYSGPLNVLKAMTGGDRITAEMKRGTEPVDFYFTGLTLLVGNGPVRPSDSTGAVINRRRSISVPNVISSKDERTLLEPNVDGNSWYGEFAAHLSGVLNWALAMTETQAREALGKDSNDLTRLDNDLNTLFETDPLAEWAERFLVYDSEHQHSQVGDNLKFYRESNTPEHEYRNLLLPHYQARVAYPVSRQKFKSKLIDLLRDTFNLPLPKGPTNKTPYKHRTEGSVIPNIRLRRDNEPDLLGVVTQAALWEKVVTLDDDQTPVGAHCDDCDDSNDIKYIERGAATPIAYRGEPSKSAESRRGSHQLGFGRLGVVTESSQVVTDPKVVTGSSHPVVADVPSRWTSGVTTVADWVALAMDTLNEHGVTADEDNIYEWLRMNESAPDISKPQVNNAVLNYSQNSQTSLGF